VIVKRALSLILMLGLGALAGMAAAGVVVTGAVSDVTTPERSGLIVQDKTDAASELMVTVHRLGLPAGHAESTR